MQIRIYSNPVRLRSRIRIQMSMRTRIRIRTESKDHNTGTENHFDLGKYIANQTNVTKLSATRTLKDLKSQRELSRA
jgi:hypothetical protein